IYFPMGRYGCYRLDCPKAVLGVLAGILVLAGVLSYTVGKDFLPPLDEGAIWIQVQLPPGISIERSKEMGAELRNKLGQFPEVSYARPIIGLPEHLKNPR
ncbi:efflux RND transporter permease subunit, partial [Bacteroides cellulosilyticus]